MSDPNFKDVETFGGEIEGIDEEGYLQVYGPNGEPLLSINAAQLMAAMARHNFARLLPPDTKH